MAVRPQTYRFTVEEYRRMAEAGILGEDERVELIEGEIVEMAPIGTRHAACVKLLNRLLAAAIPADVIVAIQDPVTLDAHTEVQPDVALVRARDDFYASAHPGPEDVLLLVEVADTSATYDRSIKVPLYARAGGGELWLFDLSTDTVGVHRDPSPDGYRDVTQIDLGGRLVPAAVPQVELEVSAILGAAK
ncbi:MAG TPA: Uma2 family endonuclease [Actinomycetota bacterium]|nr:Uma2 family endonuclease [Actinomycetota bacterium]